MMGVSIFIHGLDSSNKGTKSLFFSELFPDMIIPNFEGTIHERMKKLRAILQGKEGIKLIGSSFGGLMATIFAMENGSRAKTLILLAPALNFLESSGFQLIEISIPVHIYHGTEDEIIPIKIVKNVAEKYFSNLYFHSVKDNHFLHKSFKTIDWQTMLKKNADK